MMRTSYCWLVLLGAFACQGGPAGTATAADADAVVQVRALQPLATFSGSQCRIREPQMHRLQTQAELLAVWDRHRGNQDPAEAMPWDGAECPTIDFQCCEVIAVFSKVNVGGGVRAAEVLDEPGLRRLRLAKVSAQTDGSDGSIRRRRYTEYGYLVLPRRDVPVVIEVDDCNVIGGAPVWIEVGRL
jgi:hypothetical protein